VLGRLLLKCEMPCFLNCVPILKCYLLWVISLDRVTSYQEIPASVIYNMDGLGNDTTKHRNKVICQKTDAANETASNIQTFMQMSEGDSCMPWHITVCLTTRADGM